MSEAQIREAIFDPPTTTRAFFRGRSVARFNDRIESIQWDEILFSDDAGGYRVSLPEPSIDDPTLRVMNAAVADSKDFAEFMAAIARDDAVGRRFSPPSFQSAARCALRAATRLASPEIDGHDRRFQRASTGQDQLMSRSSWSCIKFGCVGTTRTLKPYKPLSAAGTIP